MWSNKDVHKTWDTNLEHRLSDGSEDGGGKLGGPSGFYACPTPAEMELLEGTVPRLPVQLHPPCTGSDPRQPTKARSPLPRPPKLDCGCKPNCQLVTLSDSLALKCPLKVSCLIRHLLLIRQLLKEKKKSKQQELQSKDKNRGEDKRALRTYSAATRAARALGPEHK